MAERGQQEKEYGSSDPVGAADQPINPEPVDSEPLQYVVSDSESSSSDREKGFSEKQTRPPADRTLTTTTTVSTTISERIRDTEQPRKKKPWYKRLNPLKRSVKPPVPRERTVSREYTAGFFSMLTFQWMSPLMSVSTMPMFSPETQADNDFDRLGTSGR